ncbi:MAG: DNA alkylation repair protein [Oscillospiraceae bacterium]|nr:DNA alkylation repair protein [Oscillospiraceae bacterium]MCL2278994.1 DNA alkylation repair protein [Oscillospiraceae bacterium]
MADALKSAFNYDYLRKVAEDIQAVYKPFPIDEFVKSVMDETWDNLELKARMRQITINLGKYLPADYSEAIAVIDKVIVSQGGWLDGFCLFFPDFVEVYGSDESNWDISIAALERYTPHASAEFAVRPFIICHTDRMMAQMYAWSKSENEHVRRLASEGCRPALPWGQALVCFKKDPAPILPILEQLKTDSDLYVRKSVANNLNDISKTHPELVAKIAKKWYGKNTHTDWIVKHGCRTLLKKGNREVLALFGFHDASDIGVEDFSIDKISVPIGDSFNFSFTVSTKTATKVRLEYDINFVKANGKLSKKIFQISEISMKANERKTYTKNHSFADLSTRKHYLGTHYITLFVNGTERGTLEFELTRKQG